MLQWGRDLSVAEIRPVEVGAVPAGDASMGPRPFGRGDVSATPVFGGFDLLQWGRDLSVAEIRRSSAA